MIKAQHPEVHERKIRGVYQWFFRYYEDVVEGSEVMRVRRSYVIGPSRDKDHPMGIKEAREKRDAFFAQLQEGGGPPAGSTDDADDAPVPAAPVRAPKKTEPGDATFGALADVWRREYVEGSAAGKPLLALPTRIKYRECLAKLLPKWGGVAIKDIRSKDVLDWLQNNSTSWHGMCGLRNAMSGIITKAIQWDFLPETFANPIHRVRLPKKWEVSEKRILDPEQTAQVLALIEDPNRLICETCLDTGTRISEATGLMIKHVDLDKGIIHIEQRNFHQDIDLTQPRWDSGVRKALKEAAASLKQNADDPDDPGLDFPGFGMHSLRRANISWRQEVGGTAIEASKIAGHSKVDTTLDFADSERCRSAFRTDADQFYGCSSEW